MFESSSTRSDSIQADTYASLLAANRDAIVDTLTKRMSQVIQDTLQEFEDCPAHTRILDSNFKDVDEERREKVELTSRMPIEMDWQEKHKLESQSAPTEEVLDAENIKVVTSDHPAEKLETKSSSRSVRIKTSLTESSREKLPHQKSNNSVSSRNLAEYDMFNVVMNDSGGTSPGSMRQAGKHKTVTGEGIRSAEGMDLHTEFLELDTTQTGFLPVATLLGRLAIPENFDMCRATEVLDEAVEQINKINAGVAHHDAELNMISLETFKVLMLADRAELEKNLASPEHTKLVLEVRELCVRDKVDRKIAAAYKVGKEEFSARHFLTQKTCAATYLEPAVAIVIFLNACVVGMSLDLWKEWVGWNWLEVLFTTLFVIELIIKIYTYGLAGYFLGADWSWNWFDAILVLCALVDMCITLISLFQDVESLDLQILTVVRLVRLLRIARLVRLLRFKMFKELHLMVNGVLNGFRTLIWAIVLLGCVVYALGVLMRQLVEAKHASSGCGTDLNCKRHDFEQTMFGNVGRAMLSIFICFTDGCNTPDGAPILWYFWDLYGSWLVLLYVFIFVFVTFGIFNLILATFVENTREAAIIEQQDRIAGKRRGSQARTLQQLLVKVCAHGEGGMRTQSMENSAPLPGPVHSLKRMISLLRRRHDDDDGAAEMHHLNLRVNKPMFEVVMERQDVKRLLEELDISRLSRSQLFDILDSDGNGYLAVSEIVEGIMKLRGPADKGDTISTVLMMRAFQKHMNDFEKVVLHNQRSIKKLLQKGNEEVNNLDF